MILIKIKETGPTPRSIRKHLRSITKRSLRDGIIHWHRKIRPKHFLESAARAYGYKRRTRRYVSRKIRERGHGRPLVFSGRSEQFSRVRRVTGTSKHARVSMNIPALNFKSGGSRIDLRDELTRFNKRDRRAVDRVIQRGMEERIRLIEDRRTTTVR